MEKILKLESWDKEILERYYQLLVESNKLPHLLPTILQNAFWTIYRQDCKDLPAPKYEITILITEESQFEFCRTLISLFDDFEKEIFMVSCNDRCKLPGVKSISLKSFTITQK
jgi:hypothetical protein